MKLQFVTIKTLAKASWFIPGWNLAFVSFLCVAHSLVFAQHRFIVWDKTLGDPLHKVKITAVALVKAEFCWPFYIFPITCCLHQQSRGPFSSQLPTWCWTCQGNEVSFALLNPCKHVTVSIPGHPPSSHSHPVTELFLAFLRSLLPIQSFDPCLKLQVCLLQLLWIPVFA